MGNKQLSPARRAYSHFNNYQCLPNSLLSADWRINCMFLFQRVNNGVLGSCLSRSY